MRTTKAPHVLWARCIYLMAEIRSHTALEILELAGDTPYTRLTGDTSDISHLCKFGWFDHIWYRNPLSKLDNRKLRRYLGPSHDVGQAMCSRILTKNGTEINQTTIVPLSTADLNDETVMLKIKDFDNKLRDALGDRIEGIPPILTTTNPSSNHTRMTIPIQSHQLPISMTLTRIPTTTSSLFVLR
jgi:hypothetical protein